VVGSTMRLRLTAHSLAISHPVRDSLGEAGDAVEVWAAGLVLWYSRLASDLEGRTIPDRQVLENALPPIPAPFASSRLAGLPASMLWVGEHLRDLRAHLEALIEPVVNVSRMRHRPWWR
jgi:hypothetical protein